MTSSASKVQAIDFADRGISPSRDPELENQLEKIESLGLLARGLAHDFNNLLMAILGNNDMALSVIGGSESEARIFLEEVDKASQRAVEQCRQLLAYAGRGRFSLSPIDLNWVIEESLPALSEAAQGRADLAFDLAPELPSIEGDGAELCDALLHLVRNAAEATTHPRGRVRVTTGEAGDDSRLASAVGADSDPDRDYVFVEVADEGVGMDAATRLRAFDPFFSTKPGGRGLGLASVFGTVRTLCGRIYLESLPGVGTTVRCYLPAMHGCRPLADREPFPCS